MNNKYIVLTAQVISLLYSPFYLPVFAFLAVFAFSYLNTFPWQAKALITVIVYLFTVLLPRLGIKLYRRSNGWTRHQLSARHRRVVPYFICILHYSLLLLLLDHYHMPQFTRSIIIGALAIQIVCAAINAWMKISTHAAAAGGVIGALLAFSMIFNFDPTGWLCLTVLMAGAVCTSRMILRQHTLHEIWLGIVVGLICGWTAVIVN